MASATPLLLIPTLLLLIPPPSTEALDNITSPKFAPTKAIIIATILSFAILLALYLYSRIYLFNRAATILSSRHKGLSPSLLRSFPTMLYSDIKDHKIGKSALECAVCLNEFEHKDLLRLLPNCSHIFHEDCIDAWLASHVTCPVCRDVLEKDESGEISAGVVVEEEEEEQAVAVVVEEEEDKRKERSGRRTSRREGAESLLRSYTTGHIEEDWERYTLRLPESVRNDVIVAGMLKRDRSLPVRGAEGGRSERERQSLWVGKLAQLPSFFVRSWSAKSARKGQEGSLKDGVFQSSA